MEQARVVGAERVEKGCGEMSEEERKLLMGDELRVSGVEIVDTLWSHVRSECSESMPPVLVASVVGGDTVEYVNLRELSDGLREKVEDEVASLMHHRVAKLSYATREKFGSRKRINLGKQQGHVRIREDDPGWLEHHRKINVIGNTVHGRGNVTPKFLCEIWRGEVFDVEENGSPLCEDDEKTVRQFIATADPVFELETPDGPMWSVKCSDLKTGVATIVRSK